VDVCTNSLERIRAQGAGIIFEAQILIFLGEARLALGDDAGAREAIEKAVELSTQRQNPLVVSRARIARAALLWRTKGLKARAAAAAELDEAERIVNECGVELWRPLIHQCRAQVAGDLGERAEARREMREAAEAYRRMGAARHAQTLEAELKAM